jgi:hypothetical protein
MAPGIITGGSSINASAGAQRRMSTRYDERSSGS